MRIFVCTITFLLLSNTIIISQNTRKPNVLLIMLDDLNDNTGFMGGHPQVQTPYMDALAEEGVVFTNAHTNAPICAPSRASFFTGIYPHKSKNFWFSKWTENSVLKNSKTLMHFMRDNGYSTFATGKLMHHRVKSEWDEYGIENDFGPYPFDGKKTVRHPLVPKEYYKNKNDGLYSSLANIPNVSASKNGPGYKGWYDIKNRKPYNYVNDENRDLLNDELTANWATNKIKELEGKSDSKPFFLAVGFVRPHTPLVAPQKYFDKYPLESLKLPVLKKNDNNDTFYKSTFNWVPPWAKHYQELEASYANFDEGLRAYLQAYLACVSFVDEQVGTVMNTLKKSRFNENTIVILVSDHGYNLGEKEFIYKNNLWEETTRIPMIIRAPKFLKNAGKKVNHPVSLIDVYPTIADLCDIDKTNIKNNKGSLLNGHSVKPFLNDPESGRWKGPNVALTVVRGNFKSNEPKEQSYAVRSKEYRYIRYVNGKEELYNHTKDPYEWENLAGKTEYSKTKKDLKRQMNALLGNQ